MTAKQYLSQYKRLHGKYITAIEELRTIETEIISIKSPVLGERVKSHPKNDPIGEMVCRLEDEKAKIGIKAMSYRSKMLLIKNQIAEIDAINEDYYALLLMRYTLYKDWKYICAQLSMSRSQANLVHGKALLEFDAKFSKNYR